MPGQTAAGERAFADRFARFARRFPRAGRSQHLVENLFRDRRVLVEIGHQPVVNDRVHDAVDLGVDQLDLGLRLETRIRQLDAEHADQSLAHVVARDRRVLLFHQAVGLGVLVDRLRQGGAEAGQVRAAIRIRNRVRERQNLIVVAVVVLEHDIDEDLVALARNHDRLGMNDVLVFTELLHELFDPVLVEERLFPDRLRPFVMQIDFETGVEERQFAQTARETLELELGRDRENRRIGQKRDQRAGRLLVLQLADDAQLFGRLPALESHVVDLARRARPPL